MIYHESIQYTIFFLEQNIHDQVGTRQYIISSIYHEQQIWYCTPCISKEASSQNQFILSHYLQLEGRGRGGGSTGVLQYIVSYCFTHTYFTQEPKWVSRIEYKR
jgi:hypothetical protein